MKRVYTLAAGALTAFAVFTGAAGAETMKIEAVMSPKQQMKLDFADGSKHFVLLVRREGQSAGGGPLAGGSVTEYGMHDIVRGVGGDPRGDLEIKKPSGDIAYIKWTVRAIFVPGPGGKPRLFDNGVWELAGGTGVFAAMKGAGTMHIKPVTKTDRRFILEGELVAGK